MYSQTLPLKKKYSHKYLKHNTYNSLKNTTLPLKKIMYTNKKISFIYTNNYFFICYPLMGDCPSQGLVGLTSWVYTDTIKKKKTFTQILKTQHIYLIERHDTPIKNKIKTMYIIYTNNFFFFICYPLEGIA